MTCFTCAEVGDLDKKIGAVQHDLDFRLKQRETLRGQIANSQKMFEDVRCN